MTESKSTFVIQILNNQNATWQGTVSWTDKKETQPFRSLLELIKLIDSATHEKGTMLDPDADADPDA